MKDNTIICRCSDLTLSEITGKPISELVQGTYRPPAKAIKLGEIAEYALGGDEID